MFVSNLRVAMPRGRQRPASRRRGSHLAIAALALLTAPPAHAQDVTHCQLGSSTPGASVIRFDLPEGTDFVSIEPKSSRPIRMSDARNWHLAQGLLIIDAASNEVAAARVEVYGTTPRWAVINAGDVQARNEVATPDGPFYHQYGASVPGLEPGSYYAVGFGSDGGDATPNEWWQYDLRLGGRHSCRVTATGTIFDIDHTEFSDGSQVYVPAAGTAEGIAHRFGPPAGTDLIVGLMDAAVQGPGEASLQYEMPLAAGEVDDTIVPFASVNGEHRFTATFRGAFPQILIAGVAIDLP